MVESLKDSTSQTSIDPVVTAYMSGVDVSLLRENRKLTYEERLLKSQAAGEMFAELRRAGEEVRKQRNNKR